MCLTPILLKKTEEYVPCGRCPQCKARRISAWSFRLMQEEKRSDSAYFITLTYESPVITPNGFMSLKKKDLQNFIKRLRKSQPNGKSIKYYAAGEYGGKTFRPHYHIILFNAQSELIAKAWTLNGKSIGFVHYGQVSEASVGYTMKYIAKPRRIPLHKNDDRQPEFALMSKGMGSNYLTDQMIMWHDADLENRMYCALKDGKKIAMPRYYKLKIYTDEERRLISQKIQEKDGFLVKYDQDPDFYRKRVSAVKKEFEKAAIKAASSSNNKI